MISFPSRFYPTTVCNIQLRQEALGYTPSLPSDRSRYSSHTVMYTLVSYDLWVTLARFNHDCVLIRRSSGAHIRWARLYSRTLDLESMGLLDSWSNF